jgi:hypothetical protein
LARFDVIATIDELTGLREKLVALRQDLVGRLAASLDGGEIALLGSVGAAIAAVDAMQSEISAPPAIPP